MKIKKAVIPAAGYGTRFLPATKAQPKEMLPIIDKPAIQYIVEEIVKSGIEDILIITGRGKHAIEDHFDVSYELEEELRRKSKNDLLEVIEYVSNLVNIHYVRQGTQRGLGHAIYCAKAFIGEEPFAVLYGDTVMDSKVPCIKQLMDVYEKYDRSVIGVTSVEKKEVHKFGIVQFDEKPIEDKVHLIKDMIEKPKLKDAPSTFAIPGRNILSPKIFKYLENAKPGAGGEIQLTDAMLALAKEEDVYAYEIEGRWHDIGSKEGYLEATMEYALKRSDLSRDFAKYLIRLAKSQGFEIDRNAIKKIKD